MDYLFDISFVSLSILENGDVSIEVTECYPMEHPYDDGTFYYITTTKDEKTGASIVSSLYSRDCIGCTYDEEKHIIKFLIKKNRLFEETPSIQFKYLFICHFLKLKDEQEVIDYSVILRWRIVDGHILHLSTSLRFSRMKHYEHQVFQTSKNYVLFMCNFVHETLELTDE